MYKKITNLYTGGCSFLVRAYDWDEETPRTEVSKHKYNPHENYNLSFPHFLNTKLNTNLTNDARPGHSNKYIIRKFYEYLKKKPKHQPTVAILALTELARHEIPILGTNNYHHVTPSDYHTKTAIYENHIQKYAPYKQFNRALDNYYGYLYNERTAITELVQQLNMVASYAALRTTKVIVFVSFKLNTNAEITGKLYDELSTHTNSFRFFNFGQSSRQSSLCTWVDFIRSYAPEHIKGHPLAYDNNILANIMVELIRTGEFKAISIKPANYTSGYDYTSTEPIKLTSSTKLL
jgi:hypothetical protein